MNKPIHELNCIRLLQAPGCDCSCFSDDTPIGSLSVFQWLCFLTKDVQSCFNWLMSTGYVKPCVITNIATRRFRISSCFYRSVVPTAPHNDWVFITRLRSPSQCVYTRLSHASASGSSHYLLAFWNFVLFIEYQRPSAKLQLLAIVSFFKLGRSKNSWVSNRTYLAEVNLLSLI